MRLSRSLTYTRKEKPKDAVSISHELSIRAGLISQVSAGFYTLLPMATLVVNKIENIIRDEMNRIDALEISLPIMQPAELWKESGRWEVYGAEMFTLSNRQEREYCLGPTHEELTVDLVRNHVRSAKDFPFTLYQFGDKFRDELRPRGGLLRGREFIMKDAYSFDLTDEGLDESYQRIREAYLRILNTAQVEAIPILANTGEMGGRSSEEFMAPSPAGEDLFAIMPDGTAKKAEDIEGEAELQSAIEICHIFKLGTRYTEVMGLTFEDTTGIHPIQMGCYGIGVSRMLATIIEQHHDEKGIIWPRSVAPFEAVIITINQDNPRVSETAEKLYRELGVPVLYDDRAERPGVKFNDANLIGIPDKLIVGPRGLEKGNIEYESRDGEKAELPLANIQAAYEKIRKSSK